MFFSEHGVVILVVIHIFHHKITQPCFFVPSYTIHIIRKVRRNYIKLIQQPQTFTQTIKQMKLKSQHQLGTSEQNKTQHNIPIIATIRYVLT